MSEADTPKQPEFKKSVYKMNCSDHRGVYILGDGKFAQFKHALAGPAQPEQTDDDIVGIYEIPGETIEEIIVPDRPLFHGEVDESLEKVNRLKLPTVDEYLQQQKAGQAALQMVAEKMRDTLTDKPGPLPGGASGPQVK